MTTPAPTTAPASGQPATTGQQPPASGPDTSGQTPPAGTPQANAQQPTTKPSDGRPDDPQAGKPGKTYDEAYVKSLRDEAAGHRTGKTAAEQKASELEAALAAVRKVLDPSAAEEDPKKAAEKLAADLAAKDAALKAEKAGRVAERAAYKAGANVDLLIDSKGFEAALSKLDPDSKTFEADVAAAVTAAMEAHPHLKAGPATPARSVTDTKGSSGEPPKRATSLSDAVKRQMAGQGT